MYKGRMPGETLAEYTERRFQALEEHCPNTLTAGLNMHLVECDEEKNIFVLRSTATPFMRNFFGSLHGGIICMILDQAMGHMAHCLVTEPGWTPTIEMNINFLHPLSCQDEVYIRVYMVSVTKTLIRTRGEIYHPSVPDRICATGTATYLYKPYKA